MILSALVMSMPTSAFMVSQATTVKVCETSHWVWSVWEPSFEDLIQSIGDPPPTFVEHHFANEWEEMLAQEALQNLCHDIQGKNSPEGDSLISHLFGSMSLETQSTNVDLDLIKEPSLMTCHGMTCPTPFDFDDVLCQSSKV